MQRGVVNGQLAFRRTVTVNGAVSLNSPTVQRLADLEGKEEEKRPLHLGSDENGLEYELIKARAAVEHHPPAPSRPCIFSRSGESLSVCHSLGRLYPWFWNIASCMKKSIRGPSPIASCQSPIPLRPKFQLQQTASVRCLTCELEEA